MTFIHTLGLDHLDQAPARGGSALISLFRSLIRGNQDLLHDLARYHAWGTAPQAKPRGHRSPSQSSRSGLASHQKEMTRSVEDGTMGRIEWGIEGGERKRLRVAYVA